MFWVCVCRLFHLYTVFSIYCSLYSLLWQSESRNLMLNSIWTALSPLALHWRKQQQKQQNPDFLPKAIRLWKFFSSLIASPATFSRFAGISGGRGTAQLDAQSWAPLSFVMAGWGNKRATEGYWQEPVYPPCCSAPDTSHKRTEGQPASIAQCWLSQLQAFTFHSR